MTNQANPTAEEFEQIFKSLVWDQLSSAELASVITAAPFLGLPFIKQLVTLIWDSIANRLFKSLKLQADANLIIPWVNDQHKAAFDKAAVTLKILSTDYGNQSPQYQEALKNAQAAMSKFTQFGSHQ